MNTYEVMYLDIEKTKVFYSEVKNKNFTPMEEKCIKF